jgi:hypothetical protein
MGKKIAIIETSPISVNPIDAHMRNSIALKNEFGWDLITKPEDLKTTHYDVIIISYASFYMDKLLMKYIQKSEAKLFWMTNEYNLSPNGSIHKELKKRNSEAISNFEGTVSGCSKNNIVNLNTLLMPKKQSINKGSEELIYYGTYRPDREIYFKKYFNEDIYLSTSPKNMKRFKRILEQSPKYIGKMSWQAQRETLRLFKKSLYIEDVKTHTKYNHLSNRFYEAIACGSLPVFDENCKNTIKKSNYPIDKDTIIRSTKEAISLPVDNNYINDLYNLALKERQKNLNEIKAIVEK